MGVLQVGVLPYLFCFLQLRMRMEFDTANEKLKFNLWLQYMRGRCKIVSTYNFEINGQRIQNGRKNKE